MSVIHDRDRALTTQLAAYVLPDTSEPSAPADALALRLFGYKGSLDVTIYPDAWLRDLPLLDLSPGAYVANRATMGTNMVRPDGTILVDRITVGAGAVAEDGTAAGCPG